MTAVELDPMFVKALRLLHSKSKDSADLLKQMLDDVRNQRKGQKSSSLESKESKLSKKQVEEEKTKKREAEKRSLEKLKQDISDLNDDMPAIKKIKKDSPRPQNSPSRSDESKSKDSKQEHSEKSRKDKDDREKSKKDSERKAKHEKEKEREKEKSRSKEEVKKEDSDDDMNAEDFAFGLGIACVVCNLFDVKSGNQLVECQECHHLYHQDCHKPPVTEQDVHDPRFVWYCHRCTKISQKKIASSSKPVKVKSSGGEDVKEKSKLQSASSSGHSSSGNVPSVKSSKLDSSGFFRRVDPKGVQNKESAVGNTGGKQFSGLASLAANLSGKTDQSRSGKSEASSKPQKSEQSRGSIGKSDQSDKVSLLNVQKPKSDGKLGGDLDKQRSKSSNTVNPQQRRDRPLDAANKRLQMMQKKAEKAEKDRRASLSRQ